MKNWNLERPGNSIKYKRRKEGFFLKKGNVIRTK